MPTNDSLDLAELDRLEREITDQLRCLLKREREAAVTRLTLAVHKQLQPLLDLADQMGEALRVAVPNLQTHPQWREDDPEYRQVDDALAAYQQAKGEKPCEKCSGTGARHVAGEPVVSEECGECSGEGVVST